MKLRHTISLIPCLLRTTAAMILSANLIAFANQLKKSRGMVILAAVVKGSGRDPAEFDDRSRIIEALSSVIETGEVHDKKVGRNRLRAFPYVAFSEKKSYVWPSLYFRT